MSANLGTVTLSNLIVEKSPDGIATLQIEVGPDTVRIAREKVIKDYSRRIRVPGFRPGHIPAHLVRRNVGDESIAQSVSDQLVPAAYQQALLQSELQPLERAQVDQLTFDAFDGEKPLNFTARVVVRPALELGQLEGIVLTKPPVAVSDGDIDDALEAMRGERATVVNVEGRGAQEGDVLTVDLQVFIDDKPRSEEPTRLRAFALGESSFVPRIDEQLIGAALDEERRFNVTYPSDFNDAELAGQAAEFAVKIISLKERVKPELNEEFAGSLGVDSIEELRERLSAYIGANRERQLRDGLRQQLAQIVAESAQLEVPSSLIDSRVESRVHNLTHELEHRDTTLEKYFEETGTSREQMEADLRKEIEADLRRDLVLDEIARRENMVAVDEEIERHYLMLAQTFNQPVEEIVQQIDVNSVRATILQRKAVDWLYERATIIDENGAPAIAGQAEPADAEAADETAEATPEIAETTPEIAEATEPAVTA